jgi:hypothetical protein
VWPAAAAAAGQKLEALLRWSPGRHGSPPSCPLSSLKSSPLRVCASGWRRRARGDEWQVGACGVQRLGPHHACSFPHLPTCVPSKGEKGAGVWWANDAPRVRPTYLRGLMDGGAHAVVAGVDGARLGQLLGCLVCSRRCTARELGLGLVKVAHTHTHTRTRRAAQPPLLAAATPKSCKLHVPILPCMLPCRSPF